MEQNNKLIRMSPSNCLVVQIGLAISLILVLLVMAMPMEANSDIL